MGKLRQAKAAELVASGIVSPTPGQVNQAITRKEMAIHCRRATRGVETTRRLIQELLSSMWELTDSCGVRLIHPERMEHL